MNLSGEIVDVIKYFFLELVFILVEVVGGLFIFRNFSFFFKNVSYVGCGWIWVFFRSKVVLWREIFVSLILDILKFK